MKLKTTFLILTLGCAISGFGQKSKFLFDASENPTIQRHIEEVNQKRADTTNIFSATPQSPGEIPPRAGFDPTRSILCRRTCVFLTKRNFREWISVIKN